MAYLDDAEWGERWMCAWQAKHILADPTNWSVDVLALGPDAVDVDGDPISGVVGAHRLTESQLRTALGLTADREICGAELNADSRPCQSDRGHPGDHWTPSDQADKPMWWSTTDREVGSHGDG